MQATGKNFLEFIYMIHGTDKSIQSSLTFSMIQGTNFQPIILLLIWITFV